MECERLMFMGSDMQQSKREKRRQKRHSRAYARLQIRREHIKWVIEGPDQDIDRLIFDIRANRGRMPTDLIERYGLQDDLVAVDKIERLVVFPFKKLPPLPWKPW